MEKSVFTHDYALFLRHLREARTAAGLTQTQIAERLKQTQTFVSKCERGERRIDIVELRAFCRAFGISLTQFVGRLEASMERDEAADNPQTGGG